MKKPIVIIPVRMGSKRFPGKPLFKIGKKTLLRRCYEDVLQAEVDKICITTPDQEIIDEVIWEWKEPPVDQIIKTSVACRNGTERVAETIRILEIPEETIVVNCQGDQYGFSDGLFIDGPVSLVRSGDCEVATVICLLGRGDTEKPHVVKAMLDGSPTGDSFASFMRDVPVSYCDPVFRHVGVYAATAKRFLEYLELPQTKKEKAQDLEQLRWPAQIGAYFIKDNPTVIDVLREGL